MKKIISLKIYYVILCLLIVAQFNAQPVKKVTEVNTYKWMFGLGWNALDDDASWYWLSTLIIVLLMITF
jgi:hypothetical protein